MRIHPSAQIHEKAHVESGAEIGAGCVIGPFAMVGGSVRLAERVEVKNHAVITGCTDVGDDTVVFPFAVLGEIPQDLKFSGEKTQLIIGKRNRIREHATMNTGTDG
ncbi:MAG: acyl-[acyl-carrier-protein]--UDP-N-acetylglucosamine O-acyltransferase, partial [Paracoccaceae bacterium]|nr:acyl-[acyl-carrier-protein]--UDP-N-acetylglucosamine O-acyltransferase [Paracoccaceae bacterium]